MKEVWRTISVFDDYSVSSLGRVRRDVAYGRPRKRLIKQQMGSTGYWQVTLIQNAIKKTIQVHLLVLKTFKHKSSPHFEARHLNGNPLDNRLTNLKWGTSKQNANDRNRHGRTALGRKHGRSRLNPKLVREIRKGKYPSYPAIANRLGVSISAVWKADKGITWKHL